MHVNSLCC